MAYVLLVRMKFYPDRRSLIVCLLQGQYQKLTTSSLHDHPLLRGCLLRTLTSKLLSPLLRVLVSLLPILGMQEIGSVG